MIKKRFTFKEINEEHISANIYDNNTFIGSVSIGAELIVYLLNELNEENQLLKEENELLKQNLEHCANQFKEDGKNVLLGLR